MSRPARALVALALGLPGLVIWGALPAAAQDPFDQQISEAQQQVYAAQQAAHEAANRLAAAQQQRAAVEAQAVAVQARITEIEAQIPVLRAQAKKLRKQIRKRAAELYRNSGPYSAENALPLNPTINAARAKHLTDLVQQRDDELKEKLKTIARQLDESKEQLTVEKARLAEQGKKLVSIEADLAAQQAELDRRVEIANQALERARAIGALRARGEPVQGPTILTAAQMAGWWRSRDYNFRVQGTNIDELAQIFVEEGTAEGVRGDFAFAQSIVETGGFSASPSNNFAGLGWCDSCSNGSRFPTARDGVRAQIQHLLNYADSSSRAAGLHHPPSPYWYGSDPQRAARNFDTFFAKGWAPTWNDMGHGNWATDPSYSGKVLRVYADMVAWAQTHG
jgi:hypothetical protein